MNYLNVDVLLGKVLTKIEETGDEILFTCASGEVFKMFHQQNCCESVHIEEVNGDWNDLLNAPLLMAEEVSDLEDDYIKDSGDDNPDTEAWTYKPESETWTFYKFATVIKRIRPPSLVQDAPCVQQTLNIGTKKELETRGING